MCLICVEYYYQRMTRDEVKKALPEMVLFAKTEEERNHYKKLQTMETQDEMDEEAKTYILKHPESNYDKNESKASFKTRRS